MATVPSAEPTPICSPDELQGGGRGMGSVGKEGVGVSKERGEGRE